MNTTPGRHAAGVRRRLADELESAGALHNARWRQAIETVPREMFLGERVYRRVDTSTATLWEPITPATTGPEEWLNLAYQDTTWVTQFDAREHLPGGTIQGTPTSSSTLPSLVVRMLEDLDVRDGHNVLEIGTGTGYSTALLCARLGADKVTSIEVDEAVATRARSALYATGYTPYLITGDGLAGHPARAPYDRTIATCSVRIIPPAWIAQTAPGGIVLVPVSGWMSGNGLARLQVTSPGHAEGHFLPGYVQFMPARTHAAPPLTPHFPQPDGVTRSTELGADILNDWMGRFLAQLAAPTAQHTRLLGDDSAPSTDVLIDQTSGSVAWLTRTGAGWTVRQTGPVRLWDAVETTIATWRAAGFPPQHEFHVAITPDIQQITLTTGADHAIWRLPTSP